MMTDTQSNLDELRRRIDEVDERIHDLIMERAEIIEAVAAAKKQNQTPALRPGREAAILRRLLGRHRGRFPRGSLIRMWRELLGGTVAMQTRFVVAVTLPQGSAGFWDIARDHYGSHVPMIALQTNGEVLSAVADGRATVGVLSMPSEGEVAPWWPALAGAQSHAPRVIARLPFAGGSNARVEDGDALVIGAGEPEATGADRTMLVVETAGEVSRARLISAFEAAGQKITFFASHELTPAIIWHLVEVDALLKPDDAKLTEALAPLGEQIGSIRLLGIYARPLPRDAL